MEKINVMHIIGSGGLGGAERYILTFADGVDRTRFKMTVVCPWYGPLAKELRRRGVPVTALTANPRHYPSTWDGLKLRRIMETEQVDIVHSHGMRSDALTRILRGLVDVPVHVSTFHNTLEANGLCRKWGYSLFYRLRFHSPDAMVCVSHAVADQAIHCYKADPRKVIVAHSGVDLDQFNPAKYNGLLRDKLGFEKEDFLIGVIANMKREKGHTYFLQAMREVSKSFPQAKALMVGDGPTRPHVEHIARTLGLSRRCMFTGIRSDIPQLLSMLDISVMSSVSEAISIALMESMAMAKPVVATKVGGIPELVKDGVTGLLVPPKDPAALKEAIIALLTDRERAREMGRRGREVVIKSFTQEFMVRRIEALYRTLIEEKERRVCRRS